MSYNDNYREKGLDRIIEIGDLMPIEFYAVKCGSYVKKLGNNNPFIGKNEYIFGSKTLEFVPVQVAVNLSGTKKKEIHEPEILFSFLKLLPKLNWSEIDIIKVAGSMDQKSAQLAEKLIPKTVIYKWCQEYGLPEITSFRRHLEDRMKETKIRVIEKENLIIDEDIVRSFIGTHDYEEYIFERLNNIQNYEDDWGNALKIQLENKRVFQTFKYEKGVPGFLTRDFRRNVLMLCLLFDIWIALLREEKDELDKLIPHWLYFKAYRDTKPYKYSYRVYGDNKGVDEIFNPVKDLQENMRGSQKRIEQYLLKAQNIDLNEMNLISLKRVIAKQINQNLHSKLLFNYLDGEERYECRGVVGSYFDVAFIQLGQLMTYSPTDVMLHLKRCAMPGCGKLFWAKHGNFKYCSECDRKKAHIYAQEKYRKKIKEKRGKEFLMENKK